MVYIYYAVHMYIRFILYPLFTTYGVCIHIYKLYPLGTIYCIYILYMLYILYIFSFLSRFQARPRSARPRSRGPRRIGGPRRAHSPRRGPLGPSGGRTDRRPHRIDKRGDAEVHSLFPLGPRRRRHPRSTSGLRGGGRRRVHI